jgi:hypothetical protein
MRVHSSPEEDMNEFAYTPGLYEVLRDSYRRNARQLFVAVTEQGTDRPAGPSIGARFAAARAAFFAHDDVVPVRGGQSA